MTDNVKLWVDILAGVYSKQIAAASTKTAAKPTPQTTKTLMTLEEERELEELMGSDDD